MTRGRCLVVAGLLLVATAIAGCGPPPTTVTIAIHHSAFDVSEVRVARGVPVTFVLVNMDPIDHEWLVGDAEFHQRHRTGTHGSHGQIPTEVTVPALDTVRTTITFPEEGAFAYICHLPQHEAYGMVGTVVVEA